MQILVFIIPLMAFLLAIASGVFIAKRVYNAVKENGEQKAVIAAIFTFVGTAGLVLLIIFYIIVSNVEFGR